MTDFFEKIRFLRACGVGWTGLEVVRKAPRGLTCTYPEFDDSCKCNYDVSDQKNKYDATIIWERRSHLLVGICVVKNVIADVELI